VFARVLTHSHTMTPIWVAKMGWYDEPNMDILIYLGYGRDFTNKYKNITNHIYHDCENGVFLHLFGGSENVFV